MSVPTAWNFAVALFERVYSAHPGPEPEAFRAANEAVAPLIPAVREEVGPLAQLNPPWG